MLSNYIYQTDRERSYVVKLDTAIGDNDSFGFTKATNDTYDSLPRGLKPRYVNAIRVNPDRNKPNSYRRFLVGATNAQIISNYGLQFSYKGVLWKLTRYVPERKRK